MYMCTRCIKTPLTESTQYWCETCEQYWYPPGSTNVTPRKENPKAVQAAKDGKSPLDYLVYSVLEQDAKCHKHGADKYGERNWRTQEILASTYEGAILRHFISWASGEDTDPDSGLPHLTHIRACCAVVLDSQKFGTLIDDRNRGITK